MRDVIRRSCAVSIKDAHGQYLAAFRQQRLDGKGAVQTLDELYEVAAAVLTPFTALVNQIGQHVEVRSSPCFYCKSRSVH